MHLAGHEDYKEICEDARLEDRAHFELITPRIYELGGGIPRDIRELAVLITARAVAQPFEWVMHAPIARTAGLPDAVIDQIRARSDLGRLPVRYADAARVVQRVLARESIPRELQDRVQGALGVTGLVELVVLAGYYQLIAAILFSFDTPLPEGMPAPF